MDQHGEEGWYQVYNESAFWLVLLKTSDNLANKGNKSVCVYIYIYIYICMYICASGVTVIILGNGLGDTSSNPGWGWLYFT